MKDKYISPIIDCTHIIIEDHISANSASIHTDWNEKDDPNTPQLESWQEIWQESNNFDI